VDRGKRGTKRSTAVDARGIPLGTVTAPANRHDSPLLAKTLDAVAETLGEWPESTSIHLDRGYDSGATRERLEERGLIAEISQRRASLHRSVPPSGGLWSGPAPGTSEASPQEACVVHGASGRGHRLLGGLLGAGHHRQVAHPGGLESLPLGRSSFPTAMTYPRSL